MARDVPSIERFKVMERKLYWGIMTPGAVLTIVLTPMLMLSGVFFPVEQLPGLVQAAAKALPLYHGVALARPLLLGDIPAGLWLHIAVLGGYAIVGFYLALILTRRRLLK